MQSGKVAEDMQAVGNECFDGLKGEALEDAMRKTFSLDDKVRLEGREFDAVSNNTLIEIKGGWGGFNPSDFGAQKAIAARAEMGFEVWTNSPMPQTVSDWFLKKDIFVKEFLGPFSPLK